MLKAREILRLDSAGLSLRDIAPGSRLREDHSIRSASKGRGGKAVMAHRPK